MHRINLFKHLKSRFSFCLLAIFVSGFGGIIPAQTNVWIYPLPPGRQGDNRFVATANTLPVPFEFFRNFPTYYYDIYYCRLAVDGSVDVVLTLPAGCQRAYLRGLLQDVPFMREHNTLKFTLPGPGHYYLQLPDLLSPLVDNEDSGTCTVAFWLDDLQEINRNKMEPHGKDVTDVTKAGLVPHPEKDQTKKLQAILDKGGRLYFPAGIYRSGTLRLSANTEIYLAEGALLKAGQDRSTVQQRFLHIANASRIRIHGPGTIDANYNGYDQDTPNIHILDIEDSHQIELEDLCFRNCNSWAIHLLGSDQIRCHNIKVLSGKDGIDPDSASDVMIDGVFIQAKDDAIAVKTRKPHKPTERITVRNCIVASDASALKIGTETNTLMRDILFENCDVFDSDRGLVLYARDGGPIENVTWRNIRLFMIHWPHETGGAPIQLFITQRNGLTPVRNLLLEHINANVIVPCGLAGLADMPLDDVKMRDITLRVDPPNGGASYFRGNEDVYTPKFANTVVSDRPHLFMVGDYVDVRIDGLTVDWQCNRPLWQDIAGESQRCKIYGLMQLN